MTWNRSRAACAFFVTALILQPMHAHAAEWRHVKPEDHVEQLSKKRFTAEDAAYFNYWRTVDRAFRAGDIAALESMASSAWTTKAKFANGLPKLYGFFLGLETLDQHKTLDRAEWNRQLATMERWNNKYPSSPFAKLGQARVLVNYAWNIRGHGYSNTVSEDQADEFHEKIEEARKLLQDSRPLTGTIPEWYVQMNEISKDLSEPLVLLTALVDEGVQKFPDYYPIVTSAYAGFLPKWGGSDEEFARFAKHINETASKGYGPMLYARIYYEASCCDYYDGAVFSNGHADWPTLKEGLEENRRRYPSAFNEDMEAYFACSAMDITVLPQLMDKIGNSPDPTIWKESYFFRSCQEMVRLMKLHPQGSRSDWYPKN